MRIKRQRLKKTTFTVPPDKMAAPPPQPPEDEVSESPLIESASLPPEPDWAEIPFRPPKPEANYMALVVFYEQRPCTALLHPETGLPSYMHGELQDAWDGPLIKAAETFMRENELMLAGLPRGIRIERVQESHWEDNTYQVNFVQTNKRRVPIYGSHITCNYRINQLVLVTSTLHPARPRDIDSLTWGNTTWLEAKGIALENLPPEVQPVRFQAPPDLRRESREQGLLVDRWILPYQPSETEEGVYRPVWRVVIVDQNEEHWLALIDAETQAVLSLEPGRVGITVQADVYLTALDALNSALTHGESLDYGNGATMAAADHVSVNGDRFVEPTDMSKPPSQRNLSATMFYHTRKVQIDFRTLLTSLSFSFSDIPANPDPTGDINVSLENQAGSASYVSTTHTIHLPRGVTGNPNTNPPILAISEPGFDCEVVYHEFTHALLRYVKPDVFKFKSAFSPIGQKQRKWTGALDEGLAFYFGGGFGSNSRWADYAYQAWVKPPNNEPWRDFSQGPQTPQGAENSQDPVDDKHALGMWWARAFWELRDDAQLGAEACNQLLLKAFKALAGPVHDTQAFAGALIAHAANSNHQQIVRLVMQNFGANPPS